MIDVINLFDEQTIHIWSAILMKKRVAVYSDRLAHVLRVIRALPLFTFHRQDWDILRPFVVRLFTCLQLGLALQLTNLNSLLND